MHRTFPEPYRITSLVFLSNIDHKGGGTAVFLGSHRKIIELAKSDVEKYEYIISLSGICVRAKAVTQKWPKIDKWGSLDTLEENWTP